MYPLAPSLIEHEGKATIVVRVHNPANGNVFVRAERFGGARCAVGFVIASMSEPRWSELGCGYLDTSDTYGRIHFRPGESRRLLFDVNLHTPTYGGPPRAGEVTLSAILADKIGETTATTIRP